MLKTSVGKLALGVVALSSVAVAHAEGSFVSSLKPSVVGVDGLALGGHGEALKVSNFFHAGQIQNAGINFESNTLARLGDFKIKYSPSFDWLSGQPLHSGKQVEVDENQAVKNTRSIEEVSGTLAQLLAATVNYNFTYALQGFVRAGAGAVVPKNAYKNPYGAIAVQTGASYKVSPNWSFKVGGKYIYTLDTALNNVSGLDVGFKYHL